MALTKVTGHVVLPTTNIEFHNTKSTGIVTFTHTSNATSSTTGALQITGGVGIVKDLFVGGQLSVGGTITYEDVDNINSVGIITANAGIVLQDYIFHKGDTNTSVGFPSNDTIDLITAGSPRIRIASDGKIGINTTDASHLFTVYAQSGSSTIARFKAFNRNSNFDIHTDASSHGQAYVRNNIGAIKVALNSNGDSYFTGGDVGIGTASPASKFHVDGGNITIRNGTAAGVILDEMTGVGGSLKVTTASGYASFGPGNSTFCHVQTDRTGGFYFNRRITVDEGIVGSYNEDLQLHSPINTPRVYIDKDNGNLGIGSHSPATKLQVQDGGISVRGAATPNINFNPLSGSSGNADISYDGNDLKIISNSSQADIRIGAYSKDNHIVVRPNGRVGIRTDNPVYDLDVKVDGGASAGVRATGGDAQFHMLSQTSGTCKIGMTPSGVAEYKLEAANDYFRIRRDNGEAFRIRSNGNINIGTLYNASTTYLDVRFDETTTYSATSNHVNGIKIFNDCTTDNGFAGIELAATDADDYYGSVLLKAIADGTNYSNDFVIQTRHGGNYGERIRINSTGDIIKGNNGSKVSLGNGANTQIIGNSSADSSMALIRTAQGGGEFYFAAGSSGTNLGNNNGLGFIKFMGYHTDGYDEYARIQCHVDGTNGNGDAPGRITVRTTPDGSTTSITRINIKSDGGIGIGNDISPSAGDMATGDSQNKPIIHVKGFDGGTTATNSTTGGEYNLLARFEAGGDADNTGAMIVLNHSNDRGLALIGGRSASNRSYGALKSVAYDGKLTNAMVIGGGNGMGVDYLTFYTGETNSTTARLHINKDGKFGVNTSTFTSGNNKESIMQIKAPTAYTALGIGATNMGITFGWDGDRTAYDDLRIYNVDYDNAGTYGIAGNNPTFILTPTTAPGSGFGQQTVWLKSTGRGSGNNEMNLCVDGDVTIGGSGRENGVAISGYPGSKQHGTGVSKLTIQPDHRTTAFDASDGDTWHDVVLMQGGGAQTNAVGIAFEIEDGGSYHKNAGTGIAAVKNGTNSDYGCDLAFITRPHQAVASEKMRITSKGTTVVSTGTAVTNQCEAGHTSAGDTFGLMVKRSICVSDADTKGQGMIMVSHTKSLTCDGTTYNMIKLRNREGCFIGDVYVGFSASGSAAVRHKKFHCYYNGSTLTDVNNPGGRISGDGINVACSSSTDHHFFQVIPDNSGNSYQNGSTINVTMTIIGLSAGSAGSDAYDVTYY